MRRLVGRTLIASLPLVHMPLRWPRARLALHMSFQGLVLHMSFEGLAAGRDMQPAHMVAAYKSDDMLFHVQGRRQMYKVTICWHTHRLEGVRSLDPTVIESLIVHMSHASNV